MNSRSSYRWLLLTLVILSLLAVAIFFERSGLSYQYEHSGLDFLEPIAIADTASQLTETESSCLLLYDESGIEGASVVDTANYALDSMRVRCERMDVNEGELDDIDQYQTVVIAFTELGKIENHVLELMAWVERGGRVLFAVRPNPSQAFTAIYRKMGIISKNDELVPVRGVKFLDDLFPGAKGLSLGEAYFIHNSLPVELDALSRVHLVSADAYQLPLMWSYDLGKGRIVVLNSDQFANKSARGTLAAAYSLLEDVFVYPVINSAMFFIDDFPSPIPDGEHELVTKEFGRNLKSFYLNIWWPDMQSYARRYGIKYTGVIIETYDDEVQPPFEPQTNTETFNYLGSSLLREGGEIGWHGYNHVPLCLADGDIDHQLDYPYWQSEDAMQASLEELYSFSSALFGDQPLMTYVPPSNILSPQTREWLPEALPGLRVIASVYLPDTDHSEYEQEFMEAEDGIIELPRIFAGFLPNEYMQWTAINEIVMHYVHSQFVHPDDILDEERSGGYGWAHLRNSLDDYLLWLYRSVPEIRNMTARDGAMAVQRYDRLSVQSRVDQDRLHISLNNFYDEAYLLMRTIYEPGAIEGGKLTKVAEGLYLVRAEEPEISIQLIKAGIPVTGEPMATAEQPVVEEAAEMVVKPETTATPAAVITEIVAVVEQGFAVGRYVKVNGTENRGLRMRKSPGKLYGTTFYAFEGEQFEITEGPQTADDMIWWRIQSLEDPAKIGWSVEDFLMPMELQE